MFYAVIQLFPLSYPKQIYYEIFTLVKYITIFLYMLMYLAKAGLCQLMLRGLTHSETLGALGKRPSVFSCV